MSCFLWEYRTRPKASLSTSRAGRSDLRPLISPESQYNLGHSRGIELLRNRDHALPCLIHFLRGHTQTPFRYIKYTKCWTCQEIRFLGQRLSGCTGGVELEFKEGRCRRLHPTTCSAFRRSLHALMQDENLDITLSLGEHEIEKVPRPIFLVADRQERIP